MGSHVAHDPVEWLYGLQSHGVKLGLDGIRTLLALLDHPERAFPSVLVGGTNGKGSVAAMLDAMLAASGLRTGLYTAPSSAGSVTLTVSGGGVSATASITVSA